MRDTARARRLVGPRPLEESGKTAGSDDSASCLRHRMFREAGLDADNARRVIQRTALLMGVFIVAALSLRQWLLLLTVSLLPWLQYRLLRRTAFRRAEEFERDYTALLLALASSIRTGLDPLTALMESAPLFSSASQVRTELERLSGLIDQGHDEEYVLRSFAESIAHPDIALFTTAFILARKEGSSLAECLLRLAKVTRQRQSFRRKVKGAIAMQKLSAFGITGCTIVIGGIQGLMNPLALKAALEHPVGSKALLAGGILVVSGLAWMLQMARHRL